MTHHDLRGLVTLLGALGFASFLAACGSAPQAPAGAAAHSTRAGHTSASRAPTCPSGFTKSLCPLPPPMPFTVEMDEAVDEPSARQPGPLEVAQDQSLVTETTPGQPQSVDFYYAEVATLGSSGPVNCSDTHSADNAAPAPLSVRGVSGASCTETAAGSDGGIDATTAIVWMTTAGDVSTRHDVEMQLSEGNGAYSPEQLVAAINKWATTGYVVSVGAAS